MTELSELDPVLVQRAMECGDHTTPREAVHAALAEYVAACDRLGILKWFGRVEYYDDYDHKALRKRRGEESR
jgi:hypothetical protein